MAADPQLVEAVKKLTWQMVWPIALVILGFGLLDMLIILINNRIKRRKSQQESVGMEKCPRCGGALVKRQGKFGDFLGCSNYPKCKFTKEI